METEKLAMLLRAVELKSFSKAATEFSYSPSAFSHMADDVEEKLGVRLFCRTHTGIELTADGSRLLEKLEAVVSSEQALERAAREITGENNEIRICAYSSISRTFLPELLRGFKEKFPDIHVSIVVANSFIGWLENHKADIVLSDRLFGRGYTNIRLLEDEYRFAYPADWKLPPQPTERDFYEYSFILPNDGRVERNFDLSRFRDVVRVTSADDALIVQMAEAGVGFTVLPELTLRQNQAGLKQAPLNPPLTRTITLTYLQQNKKIGMIKKFIGYLKSNPTTDI